MILPYVCGIWIECILQKVHKDIKKCAIVACVYPCHYTSSLLMKHVDAPKSSNALISVIMDLPYLNMIGNNKQGVGYEGKPFWTHDVFESSLEVLIKIGPLLQNVGAVQ